MKYMISFLCGALVIAVIFLIRDVSLSKKAIQSKEVFMTVQQECIVRVGEVWAAPQGVKPRLDLSLALALCKEGQAGRVLIRLNKERPRYKDGRVK